MANAVKVVLQLAARADTVAALRSVLLDLAEQSRGEDGCLDYQVLQSKADPRDFILAEEWTTEPALDAHLTMAHVQKAFAQGIPLLAKEPDNRRFSIIE